MITIKIVNRSNQTTDITQLVQVAKWSGDYKQASRKLEFTIISTKQDKNIPQVDIQEGYMVYFFEDDTELFRGFIYTIEKTRDTTSYMAYDHAQKLVNIKVNYNFKQKTAQQITQQMINDYSEFGLKAGEIVSDDVSYSKVFIGTTMYDTIMSAYTNAHSQNGKEYMCFAKEGKINVALKGDIKLKVEFNEKENIIESVYKSSIVNVVNKVIIVDDAGNKIAEKKDSNSIELYGLFQEILTAESQTITTTSGGTSGSTRAMANAGGSGSSSSSSSKSSSSSSSSIAQTIYNFCISKGCSPAAAAGIVANAQLESTFSTSVVNSIGASGLFQWLGDRLTNLKSYAKSRGTSWTDLDTQLNFMWNELSGGESTTAALLNKYCGGLNGFKNLTDAYKAGYYFGKCFERGGGNEKRGSTAQTWYDKLKGTSDTTYTSTNANGTTTTQTTVIDLKSAQEQAEEMLEGRERSASLDGYGDTTCITGYGVTVKDSSTGLTGLFYIDTDEHTWENGNYTIRLNLNYKNIMNEVDAGQDEKVSTSTADYSSTIISDGKNNGTVSEKAAKLISVAKSKLGCAYVWGASSSSTTQFDCSSFTQYVYKTALGINLQRTSNIQGEQGTKITNVNNLQAGDLIYFNTYSTSRANGITHVGLYIGNGQMIHASYDQKKIVTVNLNTYLSYKSTKFIWATRHI